MAAVGLFLLYEAYAKGRKTGLAKGKSQAEQQNQALQESLNRSQKTVEALQSKVAELEDQLSDKTKRLEQLKAVKDKEIADAIAVKKSELKEERAKLQKDLDKARLELEPKIRDEMEAKLEAEFKGKQEGMEAEFKARHDKERATLWTFIGVALDWDERLISLFKTFPRADTLNVLMKTKKDKAMLKELQAAAQLGQEHFIKVVEIKDQILSQSSAEGEQPGSMDNDVLTLLKKGPLTHGQIVKATGKAKSSVSDSLRRLREGGLVEQDPNTEGYYAL